MRVGGDRSCKLTFRLENFFWTFFSSTVQVTHPTIPFARTSLPGFTCCWSILYLRVVDECPHNNCCLLGTTLSAQEFRSGLSMRYDLTLDDLPLSCDGCGKKYSTRYAFKCHSGGLLTHAHNDITCETICLMQKATCKSDVSAEPRINTGCRSDSPELPVPKPKINAVVSAIEPRTEESDEKAVDWTDDEKRADIYVRHFYSQGRGPLFDVCSRGRSRCSFLLPEARQDRPSKS